VFGNLFIRSSQKDIRANYLFYFDSTYKGKVIDAETKEPIQGAVVVAAYKERSLDWYQIMDVKETLTDENGEFEIPFYFKFKPWHVLRWQGRTEFIIWKPGYICFPEHKDFSPYYEGISEGLPREYVTVRLSEAETRKARLRGMPSPIDSEEISFQKQRILIEFINEENRNLGLEEINFLKIKNE